MKEPKTGLIPQAQAQLVARLFGDQRIFVSAPQYHWQAHRCLGTEVASVWSLYKRKQNGIVAPVEQCSGFAWGGTLVGQELGNMGSRVEQICQ